MVADGDEKEETLEPRPLGREGCGGKAHIGTQTLVQDLWVRCWKKWKQCMDIKQLHRVEKYHASVSHGLPSPLPVLVVMFLSSERSCWTFLNALQTEQDVR